MKRHSLKKRSTKKSKSTKSKRNKSKLRYKSTKNRSTKRKQKHRRSRRSRRSRSKKHNSDSGIPRLTNFYFYYENALHSIFSTQHEVDYEHINFDEFKNIIIGDLDVFYPNNPGLFKFNFINVKTGNLNELNLQAEDDDVESDFNNIIQRIDIQPLINAYTMAPFIINVQVHIPLLMVNSPSALSLASNISSIEQNPEDDNFIDMSDLDLDS